MRLKVMFVIENLAIGGAERVFANLLNCIDRERFDPVLVCINSAASGVTYAIPEGVRTVNLNVDKKMALFPLIRAIRCEKPHIVFSTLAPVNFLCIISKLLLSGLGTRFVIRETTIKSISIKGTKSNPFVRFLYAAMVRTLYPFADSIVALSQGAKRDLIDNFGVAPHKISVIYNPIDIEAVAEASTELIDDLPEWQGSFKIVSVGSLVRSKGHIYLLEAMKELVHTHKREVRLVLVGTGALRDELVKKVEDFGLKDHVVFLGYRKNPFKYMRHCDLFVLPSLWEGFGNVLVEAMACGVPVISTLCESGPREIIENSVSGLLVEPGSSKELLKAIKAIMDNPTYARELAKNARVRAAAFGASAITKQYEEHLIKIFEEGR